MPRIMSKTLLDDNVTGAGSIIKILGPTIFASGIGTGDVFENADTKDICAPNSICKYLNIRLQSAVRDVSPSAPGFGMYAVVFFEKQKAEPTLDAIITAGLGTQTLGDLCRNLYRGDCIWTGAYPVSREIPNVVDIKIKLPQKCVKQERGKYLMLIKSFQTADVSDTTSDLRTWYSHDFKVYT